MQPTNPTNHALTRLGRQIHAGTGQIRRRSVKPGHPCLEAVPNNRLAISANGPAWHFNRLTRPSLLSLIGLLGSRLASMYSNIREWHRAKPVRSKIVHQRAIQPMHSASKRTPRAAQSIAEAELGITLRSLTSDLLQASRWLLISLLMGLVIICVAVGFVAISKKVQSVNWAAVFAPLIAAEASKDSVVKQSSGGDEKVDSQTSLPLTPEMPLPGATPPANMPRPLDSPIQPSSQGLDVKQEAALNHSLNPVPAPLPEPLPGPIRLERISQAPTTKQKAQPPAAIPASSDQTEPAVNVVLSKRPDMVVPPSVPNEQPAPTLAQQAWTPVAINDGKLVLRSKGNFKEVAIGQKLPDGRTVESINGESNIYVTSDGISHQLK